MVPDLCSWHNQIAGDLPQVVFILKMGVMLENWREGKWDCRLLNLDTGKVCGSPCGMYHSLQLIESNNYSCCLLLTWME